MTRQLHNVITFRHYICVDMWVWLDCGACACAHFRRRQDVCVGGLTTPALAPVPCGWSARLPCDRPRVGSTSRSPRGQVQLSIAQSPNGLCGTDTTASAGAGLGLTRYCHVAIHRILTSSIKQIMIDPWLGYSCTAQFFDGANLH